MLALHVMDTMQLIETKKAEVGKRVAKLRSQLVSAENELRNLEITSDTLARLSINPAVDTTLPRGQSLNHVLGVLGDTEEDAKSPKEIHDSLLANAITSISQDNVRTILSRYRDRLEVVDGKYWRKPEEPAEESADNFDELLGADEPQKEIEPTSEVAVGSNAAGWGVPPPSPAPRNPPSGWPS